MRLSDSDCDSAIKAAAVLILAEYSMAKWPSATERNESHIQEPRRRSAVCRQPSQTMRQLAGAENNLYTHKVRTGAEAIANTLLLECGIRKHQISPKGRSRPLSSHSRQASALQAAHCEGHN